VKNTRGGNSGKYVRLILDVISEPETVKGVRERNEEKGTKKEGFMNFQRK